MKDQMNTDVHTFCAMIRNRSDENRRAMHYFFDPYGVLSPAFSILRQELDSMIRVIYLLQMSDLEKRHQLIKSTLQGNKWKILNPKGKFREITDREMVDLSQQLQGWTRSVYRFGCAFVHLSDFHNHHAQNPFQRLTESDRRDIFLHMRNYHGGPLHDNPDMKEFSEYLPRVFDKISSNLECYVADLESGKTLRHDLI